jgi:neutral amino acid transport system ATP-binding protein
MALLEVRGLSKEFGGLHAVSSCSFDVDEGRITALIGPNGAGKTTVFNLITGLIRPSGGTVRCRGRDITAAPPHKIARYGLSRTFQITRELQDLTVLENVVVHAPPAGWKDLLRSSVHQHERERALELLNFVGLSRMTQEPAKRLSFGQRKLLELAAALMARPHIVLLDEPAGGVNPRLLESIMERILELNRDGLTLFIVEHNMDVVMQLSDSVIVMAHGQILIQDTPQAIQRDAMVLDAYLGRA